MMTDHYNILEGSDSEQESNDASRTSRKTPKRGRGKFRLMSKGSDRPYPDLLQYQAASSSYGCLPLLKRKRSAGSRPRAVGKRTPSVPVPFFLKEDRNRVVSPCKQGLKSESHAADDEGVHVAALALAEASQRGGSPQISRTPSRRRHLRHSPVPSGEKKIGDFKYINGQMDDDHLEGSLGSREAENGEFFKEASISATRQKAKKVQGNSSKEVEDDPFDDDREPCSGTEEGPNVRKTKDDTEIDVTGGRVLRPSKGSKKRSRQLFFGDESSALDALQTLADLSVNILLPVSTVESEAGGSEEVAEEDVDITEVPAHGSEEVETGTPTERAMEETPAVPPPYLIFNEDRSKATITSIPRRDPYLGDPRSLRGLEMAEAIRSRGDKEYLSELSEIECMKIGLNYAFGLQSYIYETGRLWVKAERSSLKRRDKLVHAEKKVKGLEARIVTLRTNLDQCAQDLAMEKRFREDDVKHKDDEIALLRSEVNSLKNEKARLMWEVEAGKSEMNSFRSIVHTLKGEIRSTFTKHRDVEAKLDATNQEIEELKSRMAEKTKEPSDAEMMDRIRTTKLYEADMYDIGVEGFNTARDYMVMKNLITAKQGENMDYEEAYASLYLVEHD